MTEQATPMHRGRPTHESSGPRREAILRMKAEGQTGVAIARELGITPAAVTYHVKKARRDGTLVEPATTAPETVDAD